ncbi:MAG TPA: hypothetical protein VN643_04750 [Pyrinomonadaceae bacterium]|nr:hypothetical protein [Pyrinomonadaceae bacterium]
MFIRFVSGEIDEDSRVASGLFCALHSVGETCFMPRHDWELLQELEDWFDQHLKSPVKQLPRRYNYEFAVSWFKPTAHEHLARAWEMVKILERNGLFIWTIKVSQTGPIYYEDDAQVFALPPSRWRQWK